MQDMKKNQQKQVVENGDSEKKERRHIVTWTQEEDDILRKQIGTYGTAKWYTYLNSDFKKGGWSPEEDKLLCEAQKIFGNRWTEIAKVVSGRRSHIPDDSAEISFGGSRVPFAVLPQNSHNLNILSGQQHVCNAKFSSYAQNKIQGTFLKKDDPRISALIQQAELLSSLALKVDAKNIDQSLENAWKVLQEFLNQTKKSDISRYKIPDLQLVDLKDLLEDLKGSSDGIQPCWRQMELYEDSPGSSEYSTGSTLLPNSAGENFENSLHQEIGTELKSIQIGDGDEGVRGCDEGVPSSPTLNQAVIFPSCEEQIDNDGIASALSSADFNSPLQVTPLFRSLTTGIPSPQFSESERNFLMKTLGMESPSLNLSAKTSQPPLCKRILLHSL
ncbi:unnamed protein product [Lupinus luteus]|uniref:Uncharacterized protein n=1 Tax=Lupinus luteus TaxID=3873 RepID=A0AAV1WG07_LUPLU